MSTAIPLSFQFLCRILGSFVFPFFYCLRYLDTHQHTLTTGKQIGIIICVWTLNQVKDHKPASIEFFFCILSPLRILKILPNNINHSLSKVVNEFEFDEVCEKWMDFQFLKFYETKIYNFNFEVVGNRNIVSSKIVCFMLCRIILKLTH